MVKTLVIAFLLLGLLRLFPSLSEEPVSFVLRSGFPVMVQPSVGMPYPNVLGSDVSGDISTELQQDVATRYGL